MKDATFADCKKARDDAVAKFDREVSFAAMLQLERFAMASAQHFASHDDLLRISNFKITDPDTNYHQQAGFSAEVKQVARANAENIIAGSKTRIARTDDLNQVNHQVYDYVEVDVDTGAAIIGPDGKYVGGAQMKVHKKIEKYQDHFGKNYDKYKTAKLVLPPDQFEAIMQDWEKQQSSLEEQVSTLTKQGKSHLAAEKRAEITRIKDARQRAVKGEVSTTDAMEARKSPTLSVGKDTLRIAHNAGIEAARTTAVIGGSISFLKNGYNVFNGDKSIGDASLDILTDTGRAAVSAYATGAMTATLGGALQAANGQVLRNLGKGSTPAMIVQASTVLGKSVVEVISGKITLEQLVSQISREGTTLTVSLTGSNFGAVVGTFIAPGIGTVVGGFIGGMVASMLSGSVHSALQKSVRDLELSNEQRTRTQAYCTRIIAQHNEYRVQMNAIFDQFFLEKRAQVKVAFDSISEATLRGESIREGLEGIARAFGQQLAFENGAEVRAHLRSGRVLEF